MTVRVCWEFVAEEEHFADQVHPGSRLTLQTVQTDRLSNNLGYCGLVLIEEIFNNQEHFILKVFESIASL